jgi:MFS family permease
MNSQERLQRITFITAVGDWLSYFAAVQAVAVLTNGVGYAAGLIALKSLASGITGLFVGRLLNSVDARRVLLGSQTIGAALSTIAALGAWYGGTAGIALLAIVSCGHSAVRITFEIARETLSRIEQKSVEESRSASATLMRGLYGAQFVGPALAWGLLTALKAEYVFLMDAGSFAIAALLCLSLPHRLIESKEASKLLSWVWNPDQMRLLIARGVLLWMSIALLNAYNYPIITQVIGGEISLVAASYIVGALGMFVAASILGDRGSFGFRVGRDDFAVYLIGGLIGIAVRGAFAELHQPLTVWITFFVMGIGTSLMAVSSQSMRRKLCSPAEFPSFLATENLLARGTEFLFGALAAWTIESQALTLSAGLWVSAAFLGVAVVALARPKKDIPGPST